MKRLKEIELSDDFTNSECEVLQISLTGSVLCQICSTAHIRDIVWRLVSFDGYGTRTIRATFTDGATELIPPVRQQAAELLYRRQIMESSQIAA